jgi:hypothetical protein
MMPIPEIKIQYYKEEAQFVVLTPDDYIDVYYESLPEAEAAVEKWKKGCSLEQIFWGDLEEFSVVSMTGLDGGTRWGRIVGLATYATPEDEHLFQLQMLIKIRWCSGNETDWLDHRASKGIRYHTDTNLWGTDED